MIAIRNINCSFHESTTHLYSIFFYFSIGDEPGAASENDSEDLDDDGFVKNAKKKRKVEEPAKKPKVKKLNSMTHSN